jgi:hypothetical protein
LIEEYKTIFLQDKVGEELSAAECNNNDEQVWNFDKSNV